MKLRYVLFFILFISCLSNSYGQVSDSAEVVTTFKEILFLCRNVDFSDPKVTKSGTFYKVAPYIVYRGTNEKRAWKEPANYANEDEKKGVDEVCYRINSQVNQDTNYVVLDFNNGNEKEGKWYILTVSYVKKGQQKTSYFAFLRINGRYLLGDID